MSNSAKIVPAVVEFYDIAGLVKGANKGEGLGNQFLAHIRETNAIVMVVRVFRDDKIIHVENSVDPIRDLEIVNTELIFKDLETIDKVYKKAQGEANTGDREAKKDLEALTKLKETLESGKLANTIPEILENKKIKELSLLTAKKQLYLLNGSESDVSEELKNKIKKLDADYAVADLAGEVNLSALIKKAYEILDLISFFTTGEDETRAWTIKRGSKAPQAAGAIHTDFEKNFIRAEVIAQDKLLEAKSWNTAKSKGWLRIEGKDYVVQDGDVLVIRHG